MVALLTAYITALESVRKQCNVGKGSVYYSVSFGDGEDASSVSAFQEYSLAILDRGYDGARRSGENWDPS
jgi:hypothetical protein